MTNTNVPHARPSPPPHVLTPSVTFPYPRPLSEVHRIPGIRTNCYTPLELDPARMRADCPACGAGWNIELVQQDVQSV